MSDLENYLEEIKFLRGLHEDANVRDDLMTAESGPESPEERLYTIESIFGIEGWHFPVDAVENKCPHILLDMIGEPFIKGFTDYIAVECVTCHENFDVEYND